MACALLISAASSAQSPPGGDVQALFDAAQAGDRARVAALLDRGVDVNTRSRYGITALGFAAARGQQPVVQLLIERGADVHVADAFYGSRPVDLALREGHLGVAVYLLRHGSRGAASVLMAGIRRKDAAVVKAALDTGEADATALASASTLAAQQGDATVTALVKSAAAAAPPVAAPRVMTVARDLLSSYQGRYLNASTGADVAVSLSDKGLTVTAPGQPALELVPLEERRFMAANAPEVLVTFAGRGGIIERLAIVRGNASIRYDREGFADATSPAALPAAAPAPAAASDGPDRDPIVAPRTAPRPWPAFRGANAAGVADGQGAPLEWDAKSGRNIKWKTAIPGLAVSSPIVFGDRVFVAAAASESDATFRTGLYGDVKPVDDASRHRWLLLALDRQSGRILWEREVHSGIPGTRRHTKSSQANATPATDGRAVVAVFGSAGLVVCYDVDGRLRWKKDVGLLDSGWFLDATYQWGHASSPIIYGQSVIVQADQARGSFLTALHLDDGRELWRTQRPDEVSTWGTPTVLTGAKGDELVTNGTKVRGYDPATGELLWTLTPNSEIAIGSPVTRGDVAYVTAGYPPVRPVYAIRAGARGDISLPPGTTSSASIAWSHDRDGTYISTPIVYRDQLYTLNQNGILTAYDAVTGERLYRARVGGGGAFSASPIAADGHLYMASEDGDVFVVRAGREYLEVGKNVMGEVIMATPAISDGVMIVRTLGHVWGIAR